MDQLTEEQKRIREQNRARALAIRKQREMDAAQSAPARPSAHPLPPSRQFSSSSRPPLSTLPAVASSSSSRPTSFTRQPTAPSSSSSSSVMPSRPPSTLSLPSGSSAPTVLPTTVQASLPKSNVHVMFSVATDDQFKLTFCPFHDSIVLAIKKLASRTYDPQSKAWLISFNEMEKIQRLLKEVQEVTVTFELIPENVMKLLKEDEKKKDTGDLASRIDPSIISALFAYQRKGVIFGVEHNGRVLIADEMGLGKSIQALAIARFYKEEWPLIIVCPSSVKGAWKGQIERFLPCIKNLFIIEKGSDPLPDHRTSNTIVIMSYEQMVIRNKKLLESNFYVYIFDESHYIKDGKSKRTQAATLLSKKASRVICVSGTPALSRPAELFSQVRCVNDRIFPNFHNFAIRYCEGQQGKFGFESKGCSNSSELCAILSKKLMIRRLKADVLPDLPEKRRELLIISDEKMEKRIDDLQKAKQAFQAANSGGNFSFSDPTLLEYYIQTGLVKAEAVCSHIIDNFFYKDCPPRKILIFAHHQVVMDTIMVELGKVGINSIRIDGQTPAHQRPVLCDRFQTDEDVQAAVLSITAAGVGITLTAASVVIFAELHFNPGMLLQAEDRAHRVGQKDSVFVQYLLARNTADDNIWRLIEDKIRVLGQVNLSGGSFEGAGRKHKTVGAIDAFSKKSRLS